MNIYTRSVGIFVSSLFFFFQTQVLSAQEPAAPRSAATTVVAAEPQAAGQSVSSPPQVVPALPVPRLIKFSGVAKDASGQLRSGVVGITFSIYADQQGGATLWMETQNLELDAHGRYAVLLGSTRSAGLPLDLFTTGEPRWLGAKLELPEEVEQPRVLLVSVPYALKASDADTVGGMPASAFVLAPTGAGGDASTPGSTKSKAAESKAHPQFTSSGTANYIPIFTDSSGDIGNSNIYQTGGKVGIGYAGTMTANLVVGAPSGGSVLNSSNLVDQDMFVTLTAPGASDKHAYFGPSTATNLTLGTGGVEKVRITNAGNVGIGYSNPQQRLVIGAPAGGTVLNATNLADQDLNVIVSVPGASNKYTYFGPSVATNLTLGVGLTEMMRIKSTGQVNVDSLSLNNGTFTDLAFGYNSGEGISSSRTSGSVNQYGLDFFTGFNRRMSITNGGSVGIGTTTPAATLEVKGTGQFDNGVYVYGNSASGTGVYGSGSTAGVSGTGGTTGVSGTGSTTGTGSVYGIYGTGTAVTGDQAVSIGVYGTGISYGVYGISGADPVPPIIGVGVHGTGSVYGVWGSANSNSGGTGVYGDGTNYGVYGYQTDGGNYGVYAYGNIGATGTIQGGQVLADDRVVSLYAMESPENWFEDFGTGQLKDGLATIELDATFAQTVNTDIDYHVFLTSRGECEGLYVGATTASGFEVRELHHGTSNIKFDYRIVAKRKGLESLRLEDQQADRETAEAIRQQIASRPSHPPRLKLPKPPQQAAVPGPPK